MHNDKPVNEKLLAGEINKPVARELKLFHRCSLQTGEKVPR